MLITKITYTEHSFVLNSHMCLLHNSRTLINAYAFVETDGGGVANEYSTYGNVNCQRIFCFSTKNKLRVSEENREKQKRSGKNRQRYRNRRKYADNSFLF